MQEQWGYETTGRIPVDVHAGSKPVVDAQVTLLDADGNEAWTAHTDNHGRAELFAGVFATQPGPFSVHVEDGGETADVADVTPGTSTPVDVSFAAAHTPTPSLDLMFLVDTTGSMGDELSYIQAELGDVIDQAQRQFSQSVDLRVSVDFYKDVVDTYTVRSHPFTRDMSQIHTWLAAESAGGGGDFPEAVDQGLDQAITDHDWRPSATARLLFMVLDAPPHSTQDTLSRYQQANAAAAAAGVRIIPVAGSGVDKSTEFILRFTALTTNGTYTFLTNDSGIGGSHIAPTIGDYTVEYLNELMTRLIVQDTTID